MPTDSPEIHPGLLTRLSPGRRSTDRGGSWWPDTRDLLVASVAAPLRPVTRPVGVLALAVLLAESTGFVVRRACSAGGCSATVATRWDMDAIGSVPRLLVTLLLAAASLVCLRAVWRAGHQGAGTWWLVLGLGAAALAAAKSTSVHYLVEARLAGVLPGADVQLLFVLVSALGLLVVIVSGRWVRRETRTVVTTWLGLYAAASVGLAALTIVLGGLGPLVADLSTLVEETGEGLAAVGLLAVVLAESRLLAARRR